MSISSLYLVVCYHILLSSPCFFSSLLSTYTNLYFVIYRAATTSMTSRYHLFCVVFLTFFIVSSTWYIPDTLGWCKEIISTLVVLVASKLDTINQWIVARGPRGSNHHAIHSEVPIYTAGGGVQGSDETRDIITEEKTDNDDCSLLVY